MTPLYAHLSLAERRKITPISTGQDPYGPRCRVTQRLPTILSRAIDKSPRCRSLVLSCIPEPVRNRPLAFRGPLRTEALVNQSSQLWRGQAQEGRITPAAAGGSLACEEALEARALIFNLEPQAAGKRFAEVEPSSQSHSTLLRLSPRRQTSQSSGPAALCLAHT